MRHLVFAALIAVPATAHAQMQFGGNIGYRSRADDGHTVTGTQLEAMLVRPAGKTTYLATLAIVQMRNHTPAGVVRENSFEGALLYRRAIVGALGAALGPAVGLSFGCASGGTGGTGYGSQPCAVYFADKGTVRPGYALQLDWSTANARGAVFRAGVRAIGHTVASGSKTPKPAVWLGFTLPLTP